MVEKPETSTAKFFANRDDGVAGGNGEVGDGDCGSSSSAAVLGVGAAGCLLLAPEGLLQHARR